jgi:hypothetical protein
MLNSTVLMSYLQWEGLAIFIGLNHRLRKPEVIGFVSLIDHYDVQFKVVGISPPTPPKVGLQQYHFKGVRKKKE